MINQETSTNLYLQKFPFYHAFAYASEVWSIFEPLLKIADMVFIYGQKNSGKSTIGYQLALNTITNKQNLIFARLQDKEMLAAAGDIVAYFQNKGFKYEKVRGYGQTYYLNGDIKNPTLKFIGMGSYQQNRSSINENTGLIFFDEINASQFPSNFTDTFLNMLSTMGRDKHFKLFGAGNNETAQNNPILQMTQIQLDWSYTGLQVALRVIQGAVVLVIQLGGDIFDPSKRPLNLSARLGSNIEEYADKFLHGINTDITAVNVLNIPEFIKLKRPLLLLAADQKCYAFWSSEINDPINEVHIKNAIYILEVRGVKKVEAYKSVPFYAVDEFANMTYPKAVLIDKDQVTRILQPFYIKLKNRQVFFKDFDTQQEVYKIYSYAHLLQGELISRLKVL